MTDAPSETTSTNTQPASNGTVECDLVIVGAGPVGLALACMLAKRSATAALSVVLLDARDGEAARADPRTLALSHGSRVLLGPLGWPNDATPIEKIHVSQRGHFGRALIEHHEHGLPALGYVVRYGSLTHALRGGLERIIAAGGKVRVIENHTAVETLQDAEGVNVRVQPNATEAQSDVTHIRCRLVIHAEGGLFAASAARPLPGIVSRDYDQTAIVGTVRTSAPRPRMAWERFTPEGPIALLPLGESTGATPAAAAADYALVWCQSPEQTQARLRMDDASFLTALDQAFGDRVGKFTHINGRATFALGLNRRSAIVDGRSAAIGNAAQTLHPVAGQGLNLGLRDAQALAGALVNLGATPHALAEFAAKRQIDRAITIGATDALARGFTIDFGPLAHLRGAALAALDLVPFAKHVLARQMMFGQRR